MMAIASMATFFSVLFCIPFVKKNALKYLKNPTQPIRNDLIIDHSSKKKVLPLGGFAIMFSVLVGLLVVVLGQYMKTKTFPASTIFIAFGVIVASFTLGLIDDIAKITKRTTGGISGRIRFWIEIAIGLVFAYIIVMTPEPQKNIAIAFPVPFLQIFSFQINPYLYIVFKAFVFAACLNAFNVTDGLDGLAATQFLQFALAFLVIFLLQIISGAKMGSGSFTIITFLTLFSFAVLGFLCYNSHPATIFMGDGGSLMLGAVVAISTLLCNFEFSLLFLAFIPFIETLSVILQVGSFKLRKGKRIFQIAPIHHHFEATGHKETKVVFNFFIVSIVISSIFIGTLFLR